MSLKITMAQCTCHRRCWQPVRQRTFGVSRAWPQRTQCPGRARRRPTSGASASLPCRCCWVVSARLRSAGAIVGGWCTGALANCLSCQRACHLSAMTSSRTASRLSPASGRRLLVSWSTHTSRRLQRTLLHTQLQLIMTWMRSFQSCTNS